MFGIIVAKFARPKKRAQNIIFSRNACIYHRDGIPCLVFKVADSRKSYIVQAQVRARMIREKTTEEGEFLDFFQDEVKLTIDNCNDRLMLMWPTLVTHKIDEKSPLYNMSAQDVQRGNFEIIVMLEGGVESTGLAAQARTSYLGSEILWGHRFQSTISYREKIGEYGADFDVFHKTFKVNTHEISAKELKERKALKLITPNGISS
jgi:potassium inwardly-rectifying channel subfamily J, other